MAVYRYYLSANPGDPSPSGDGLSNVEADCPQAAIRKLHDAGQLPEGWQSLWIHFLVWVDQEGQQRGFESIALCNIALGEQKKDGRP
jgi:hypothetical protein